MMRVYFKLLRSFFALTTAGFLAVNSLAFSYVVKKGDTLSELAYRHIDHKVYGPKGSLKKLLASNPDIKSSDLILVGQNINIPLPYKRDIASVPEMQGERTPLAKPKQSLYLGTYLGNASISSKDTVTGSTEKAASNIGQGFHAVWTQHWSDNLSFFVVGSLKRYKFSVGRGRTLADESVTQAYVGTGLNIKVSDRVTMTPGLGIGESLILSSLSTNALEIKKAVIPAASLSTKVDLVKFKSGYTLHSNLRLGALLPKTHTDYKTELGTFGQLGVGSGFNVKGMRVNVETSYTHRSIDVGTAEQTSKDLGITLGVGWSF